MRAGHTCRPMVWIIPLLAALLGGFAFPGMAVAEDAPADPPEGYPREIRLRQAERVLKQPLKAAGVGCGMCKWDGESWSFSSNAYRGQVKTPWLGQPVSLAAQYAHSNKENFLIGLVIDQQEYRRDKRSDDRLVWKRDLRTAK